MSVAVIVPFRGGCPHRTRALAWVRRRYAEQHPGCTFHLTTGSAGGGTAGWCKAAEVMPAIERCSADVVIVADADCWTDGLAEAVQAVESGHPWGLPHKLIHRLSEQGTKAVLDGADWQGQPLDQRPYVGIEGGGYVVAHRETLLSVPMDSRFVGWGQEDMSWALALRTMLGPPWRGTADLLHLFHPSPPRMTRRRGSQESWQLYRRYNDAKGNPQAMRALLNEVADVSHPTAQ